MTLEDSAVSDAAVMDSYQNLYDPVAQFSGDESAYLPSQDQSNDSGILGETASKLDSDSSTDLGADPDESNAEHPVTRPDVVNPRTKKTPPSQNLADQSSFQAGDQQFGGLSDSLLKRLPKIEEESEANSGNLINVSHRDLGNSFSTDLVATAETDPEIENPSPITTLEQSVECTADEDPESAGASTNQEYTDDSPNFVANETFGETDATEGTESPTEAVDQEIQNTSASQEGTGDSLVSSMDRETDEQEEDAGAILGTSSTSSLGNSITGGGAEKDQPIPTVATESVESQAEASIADLESAGASPSQEETGHSLNLGTNETTETNAERDPEIPTAVSIDGQEETGDSHSTAEDPESAGANASRECMDDSLNFVANETTESTVVDRAEETSQAEEEAEADRDPNNPPDDAPRDDNGNEQRQTQATGSRKRCLSDPEESGLKKRKCKNTGYVSDYICIHPNCYTYGFYRDVVQFECYPGNQSLADFAVSLFEDHGLKVIMTPQSVQTLLDLTFQNRCYHGHSRFAMEYEWFKLLHKEPFVLRANLDATQENDAHVERSVRVDLEKEARSALTNALDLLRELIVGLCSLEVNKAVMTGLIKQAKECLGPVEKWSDAFLAASVTLKEQQVRSKLWGQATQVSPATVVKMVAFQKDQRNVTVDSPELRDAYPSGLSWLKWKQLFSHLTGVDFDVDDSWYYRQLLLWIQMLEENTLPALVFPEKLGGFPNAQGFRDWAEMKLQRLNRFDEDCVLQQFFEAAVLFINYNKESGEAECDRELLRKNIAAVLVFLNSVDLDTHGGQHHSTNEVEDDASKHDTNVASGGSQSNKQEDAEETDTTLPKADATKVSLVVPHDDSVAASASEHSDCASSNENETHGGDTIGGRKKDAPSEEGSSAAGTFNETNAEDSIVGGAPAIDANSKAWPKEKPLAHSTDSSVEATDNHGTEPAYQGGPETELGPKPADQSLESKPMNPQVNLTDSSTQWESSLTSSDSQPPSQLEGPHADRLLIAKPKEDSDATICKDPDPTTTWERVGVKTTSSSSPSGEEKKEDSPRETGEFKLATNNSDESQKKECKDHGASVAIQVQAKENAVLEEQAGLSEAWLRPFRELKLADSCPKGEISSRLEKKLKSDRLAMEIDDLLEEVEEILNKSNNLRRAA